MRATAPLAHTPMMVSSTELKSAKLRLGRAEVRIQLYGVPPMSRAMSTISLAYHARMRNRAQRMDNLMGSSASVPMPMPKFLNRFQIQISRIRPMARATKTWYMVSAAGK